MNRVTFFHVGIITPYLLYLAAREKSKVHQGALLTLGMITMLYHSKKYLENLPILTGHNPSVKSVSVGVRG